ncbi:hypothetical protein CUJ84_Chr002310 [Rhizobium leguminosarum]|uniref:Uncharacterized protein n=1 Tax=Rhizobium leguminosarum TaxID=384 RepID=A0A2K9Z371_RHILE|nr:hypothetical protein CUJ84_Chr002310 [Rhizobium leguminosarum]
MRENRIESSFNLKSKYYMDINILSRVPAIVVDPRLPSAEKCRTDSSASPGVSLPVIPRNLQ